MLLKAYNVTMVEPLEDWKVAGYSHELAQRAIIFRRQEFLELNQPTQQKIISLPERMDSLIVTKSVVVAQKLFFREYGLGQGL